MFEVTCPTTARPTQLGRDRILSSHRVSTGHVVYLRCTCGSLAVWSRAHVVHPRPTHVRATRAA